MPYDPPPHAPLGERGKLVQFLRIFSSDQDGEVINAARMADKLVRARKLDWDEIIRLDLFVSVHTHADYTNTKNTRTYKRKPPEPDKEEIELIRRCGELKLYLTKWERDEFIPSLSKWTIERGKLTEKQRAVLDKIVNELKRRNVWNARKEREGWD